MAQNYKPEREAREERGRVRGYQARRAVHDTQVKRRKRDNLVAGAGLVVVLVLLVSAQVFYFSGGPGTPATTDTASDTPTDAATDEARTLPSPDVAENRTWTGTLTLNDIPLGLELDGARAPQAVASTITLAQDGFYDGIICHRLTTEGIFVLQCGDPDGTGEGGPGYAYGPIENGPADNFYPAGTLAMARVGGDGASMGSQFFIVYEDTTIQSDDAGAYTVMGRVTSGLDELKAGIIDAGTVDGSSTPAVETTITAFSVQ
ncbi:peptidylprolyl isomerase [Cryobacterium melibiosiphilum]|uniref:Peptidylprolyl isomerase n=1 Tax=Cryobacterium melibiosiphilum TaxID=995039 RepID=A0A3A5MW88_9MICO|nr:peptidylprolyl isomerase [Cryobacterium melibiosiphilum]RJT89484.1 peptidylprolyl isomerase [Cryobacterium melibiosiphilum]